MEVTRRERGCTLIGDGIEVRVAYHGGGSGAYLARIDEGDARASDAAFSTMARALRRELDGRSELVTWDDAKRTRINDALRATGYTDYRRKLFVMRDLKEHLPPGGDFAWRTLAEIGEPAFIDLMTRCAEGDPFPEDDFDPQQDWRELLEHAGASFDPNRWRAPLIDGEPAGVVLPTPYPGAPIEGTISYVGILPAFRGRGFGRALHASGLRLLAEAGCTIYKGSTDHRNKAMARVFEKNGCAVDGVQLLMKRAE